MCVIVDANRASVFFTDPFTGDYAPVVRWIHDRDGRIVHGGRLTYELEQIGEARKLLLEWKRAGRVFEVDESELESDERIVKSLDICRSNDHHVIALARRSGARVLCTEDIRLMEDFQDRRLIQSPRGKIYRNASHVALLKHSSSCKAKIVKKRR